MTLRASLPREGPGPLCSFQRRSLPPSYLDSSVKGERGSVGDICSFRRRLLSPSAHPFETAGAAELSRPAQPPKGSLDSFARSRSKLPFDGRARGIVRGACALLLEPATPESLRLPAIAEQVAAGLDWSPVLTQLPRFPR